MRLCLLNGIADINEDKSAVVRRLSDSTEPSEPLYCKDITRMFTSVELLSLIGFKELDVAEDWVWKFCRKAVNEL